MVALPDHGRLRQLRTTIALKGPLLRSRTFDLALLFVLFTLILLYQLQFVASWITDLRVREVLYVILYLRIIFFYRVRWTRTMLLVLLYLGYCAFVGLRTSYLYGDEMAVKGFTRFVNVALLAPLIAVLISSRRQIMTLIGIWLVVAALGAASGIYQLMGGDLTSLTGNYISIRGDVIRYMTLLGEPNVGGMASPLVLLVSAFVVRSSVWRVVLSLLSVILLLFSVSKAGIAGFGLAIALIVFSPIWRGQGLIAIRRGRWIAVAIPLLIVLAMLLVALTALIPDLMQTVEAYVTTAGTAFVGDGDVEQVSPSVIDDLNNRLFDMFQSGVQRAQADSSYYALDMLIGGSYGIAGSAAQEVRGEDVVITPHNGFAETYFVGGVVLLILFFIVIIAATRRLRRLSKHNGLYAGLFAGFVVCTVFTVAYPVMYTIFLGAFFWLAVGVASNRLIVLELEYEQTQLISHGLQH